MGQILNRGPARRELEHIASWSTGPVLAIFSTTPVLYMIDSIAMDPQPHDSKDRESPSAFAAGRND